MRQDDDLRPVRGWPSYWITRDGRLFSEQSQRHLAYAHAESGAPYLEISILGTKHRRSISRAVMEAWGDISQLTAEQKRWFDRDEIRLHDHLVATYRPKRQWRVQMRKAVSERDYGKRGLFQVAGRIGTEIPGAYGEWALMPRDPGWAWARYPLCDFHDIEPAPPGAGKYEPSALKGERK